MGKSNPVFFIALRVFPSWLHPKEILLELALCVMASFQ